MKNICDDNRHLICEPYSIENLHKMAKELGLKRHWFHKSKTGLYHYDIPKKRIEEIKSKCEVVSTRELLKRIKESEEFKTYKQKNILSSQTQSGRSKDGQTRMGMGGRFVKKVADKYAGPRGGSKDERQEEVRVRRKKGKDKSPSRTQ